MISHTTCNHTLLLPQPPQNLSISLNFQPQPVQNFAKAFVTVIVLVGIVAEVFLGSYLNETYNWSVDPKSAYY